jgi:triosephosphate isomerase
LLDGLRRIDGVDRVVCPTFTAIPAVAEMLEGMEIGVGAQNMHWEESGAFTGEIAPPMVAEYCDFVILGHSERRTLFGERDETVNRKVKAALKHSITPIVCVGETLEENEADRTAEVVSRQMKVGLAELTTAQGAALIVAYEPVWAIGTGRAATAEGANDVIKEVIRPVLAELFGDGAARSIRVLYGGSVKPDNAREIFEQPDIDGGLIGGASLKSDDFVAIVKAAIP